MSSRNGVYAIIPARGGSKGVPGKNLRALAGFPLIAYSIASARLSSTTERIVVSTDSPEIADVARRYGAEVPFMRPAELARDQSTDREFVLHALEWFREHEGSGPDFLVHLRPTTPLREPGLVDDAITAFLSRLDATSLRSAHEAPESPFKWFMRDASGFFHGFNPDDPRPGYSNLPRQDFPAVYVPDGYVDVLRSAFVLNADDIHGRHIMSYVSPACVEVDTTEDFDLLEFQLHKHSHPLLEFLKTNNSKEVQ